MDRVVIPISVCMMYSKNFWVFRVAAFLTECRHKTKFNKFSFYSPSVNECDIFRMVFINTLFATEACLMIILANKLHSAICTRYLLFNVPRSFLALLRAIHSLSSGVGWKLIPAHFADRYFSLYNIYFSVFLESFTFKRAIALLIFKTLGYMKLFPACFAYLHHSSSLDRDTFPSKIRAFNRAIFSFRFPGIEFFFTIFTCLFHWYNVQRTTIYCQDIFNQKELCR
jgi:hypothetical protein